MSLKLTRRDIEKLDFAEYYLTAEHLGPTIGSSYIVDDLKPSDRVQLRKDYKMLVSKKSSRYKTLTVSDLRHLIVGFKHLLDSYNHSGGDDDWDDCNEILDDLIRTYEKFI